MQEQIGNKTIGGMMAFLSQMVEKGRARDGVVKPLDTAIRKVFSKVAGEGWENIGVDGLDLDDYMLRFGNMTNGIYTSSSLSVYRSRIRKSLEWYEKFLSTPGWVPPLREVSREKEPLKAKTPEPEAKASTVQAGSAVIAPASQPAATPKQDDGMISYPLPLASGTVIQLYLPVRLTQADSRRIAAFVTSLAFEEPETAVESALE
jgi:hypothetical protein